MQITPTFSSVLVELRPFKSDDLPALSAYLNHPDLTGKRYIPWDFPNDVPLSEQQVEGVLKKWGEKKKGFVLAVVLQESGSLIGHAEADWGWDPHSPGVSLAIAPPHQRQGYGSDVVKIILEYLFMHTPAHNISNWIAGWNKPAINFAIKNGFQECGEVRRDGIRNGEYFNSVVVDILRPEWKKKSGG